MGGRVALTIQIGADLGSSDALAQGSVDPVNVVELLSTIEVDDEVSAGESNAIALDEEVLGLLKVVAWLHIVDVAHSLGGQATCLMVRVDLGAKLHEARIVKRRGDEGVSILHLDSKMAEGGNEGLRSQRVLAVAKDLESLWTEN